MIIADKEYSTNIDHHEQNMSIKIAFPKLDSLELVSLPNLTSFCSVDQCTTNFDLPGLRNAVVAYCNELKFFCHGDVSAPKLRTVEMDYDYKALAREGL